ncbi:polygalacturonase-like [Heracleum sosnowskyi]|uniref:Polygalacturonase-like n=1 Tax=Heracleum sosnowskyi TaxID=360622 RepID=A0AAD8MNM2_9APIA|nr:polygalacturonase-like [Heracleum sosnowskyi]
MVRSAMAYYIVLTLCIVFLVNSSSAARVSINVQRLGARADGKTDVSKILLRAWNSACASRNPAQVYLPKGRYLIRSPIVFSGRNCRRSMAMRIDGTIVASTNYNLLANSENWIKFERVNGLTITGGTIDAKGNGLWNCKKSGKNCPTGATTLGLYSSTNVVVSGLTLVNSQMFHMIVYKCNNANIRGIKISARASSPNTDGIHIQLSSGTNIVNSRISTGDDCVSIGPGTTNTWIENVSCGPGHGISIGSLGWDAQEPGVQNLTVKSVTFRNTDNGVRIKTWARSSTGFVRNVLFQHIVMNNVANPVLIDQDYCPNVQNCPSKVSGVRISNIRYQDIRGSSATPVAVQLQCSKKYPCSGIRLQDIALTYRNQAAKASCSYAGGSASGVMKPSSCL